MDLKRKSIQGHHFEFNLDGLIEIFAILHCLRIFSLFTSYQLM